MHKTGSTIVCAVAVSMMVRLCGCETIEKPTTETAKQASITPIATITTAATTQSKSASETDGGTRQSENTLASAKLAQMTLKEKVCQMFILTPEALTGYALVTQAGDVTKDALEQYPVGGLIYFGQNLETIDQTKQMLSGAQEYATTQSGIGLFLAVDEEGGTVARCADYLGTTAVDSMENYGAGGDPAQAYQVGTTIGEDLASLGFNLDFAPVADVNINAENELGDRIFSRDPAVVSAMTAEVVKGLRDQGVCATLKHFPGLGAGNGNTHHGSVYIDRSYDELTQTEFVAFAGGISAGADFVMVGHQITAASGDNLPGDLSFTVVTQWLKEELGFMGLAVTDAQNMGAIEDNYSAGDAAVMAVQAGIDVILMPEDFPAALSAIVDAVNRGTIPQERIDESVGKILAKKEAMGLLK